MHFNNDPLPDDVVFRSLPRGRLQNVQLGASWCAEPMCSMPDFRGRRPMATDHIPAGFAMADDFLAPHILPAWSGFRSCGR